MDFTWWNVVRVHRTNSRIFHFVLRDVLWSSNQNRPHDRDYPVAFLRTSGDNLDSSYSLSLDLRHALNVGNPRLRGTEPDLPTWPQLGALFERADTERVGLCILRRSGV
jgi:hypothetical protein